MAQDEAGEDTPEQPEEDAVANRRQLIRLAVQRRPDITVEGLHRALKALQVDVDRDTLLEDLASFDVNVQHDPSGAEALGGPGMAKLLQPDVPLAELEEPPPSFRDQLNLKNPTVVAAGAAAAVLVVILIGVLVFRSPKSDDSGLNAGGSTTTVAPGGKTATTKPGKKSGGKKVVAPAGPGADPLLAKGAAMDQFDRSGDGLGIFSGIGPYLVGAGTWKTSEGHAHLVEANPGGPSLAWVDVKSGDVRAQVTLVNVTEGAGLAFRIVDRKNYWLWVASPHYATVSLLHVVDGKAKVLGNSGITSLKAGVKLGIHTSGKTIELLANGVVVKKATDDSATVGTGLGLGANLKAPPATYDSLTLIKG